MERLASSSLAARQVRKRPLLRCCSRSAECVRQTGRGGAWWCKLYVSSQWFNEGAVLEAGEYVASPAPIVYLKLIYLHGLDSRGRRSWTEKRIEPQLQR